MLSVRTPNEKLFKRTVQSDPLTQIIKSNSVNHHLIPSASACSSTFNHFFVLNPAYNLRWNHANQFKSAPPAPLVIAGPSGCGKTTLLKRLMNEFQDCFGFSISHTTRQPRKGEQHGKEYFFITPETFEESIQNDEFIEYTRFSNNYYGTSKKAVMDVQNSGKICILDVEIDGVKNLKKTDLNPRFVFIKPPNLEILEQRLRSRGTETEESIQQRLNRANEELKFGEIEGMFDLVILNDDIEEAYSILRQFVLEDIKALKMSRGM